MSETPKGEHGPESGHQTVAEFIAKNKMAVAERQTAIVGLQGRIAEVQKQVDGLQGRIAEIITQVTAKQDEIYELEDGIAEPKRYKQGLVEFVNRLRQQDVGDWGDSNIVDGFFNSERPPLLTAVYEARLTPGMKNEIVQSVLAETGLTEQEARDLVKKQAEARKAKRE